MTLRQEQRRTPAAQTTYAVWIHIGPRRPTGDYPLHLVTVSGEVRSRLVFPERLLKRAAKLLHPSGVPAVGDEAAFGAFLARQLFSADVRVLLLRSIVQARENNAALRLLLQIDPPEVAALPWEWLTVAGKTRWSPALLADYGVIRVPQQPATWQWGRNDRPRELRVLVVAANPNDETLLAMQIALKQITRERHLPFQILMAPSIASIYQTLQRYQPDILHIIAPVKFQTPGQPLVVLAEDHDGNPLADMCFDETALRLLLQAHMPQLLLLDGDWLQAGILNAAATRLALNLVAQNVPACIASHRPLYPAESIMFVCALYAALIDGAGLIEAVAVARQALMQGESGVVWGMPMLAMCHVAPPGEMEVGARKVSPRALWRHPFRGSVARMLGVAVLSLTLLYALVRWGYRPTTASPTRNEPAIQPESPRFYAITAYDRERGPLTPPQMQPAPTPVPATPPPVIGWATYVVAPGDTLDSIAERMGSTPDVIAQLNRFAVDSPVPEGRALVVPVHTWAELGLGGLDVNSGRQDRPLVALTFDIEINDTMLYQYLELLQQRGIQATFFVTGNWVQSYPDAARAIVAAGHELGNHSLTHASFPNIGLDGAIQELQITEDLVIQTTGVSTRPFFRFPYGHKDAAMLNLVAEHGYLSYHWTTDDVHMALWLQAVAAGQRNPNGAIILLHQRPESVAALPGWLDQMAALGLTPVPLSQILQ